MPRIERIARRFGSLPNSHRLLLMEALARLAWARAALLAVSFKTLAARFGTARSADSEPEATGAATAEQVEQAREISWAVTRAARYAPFRAVCLPQAMAAKAMLAKRGIPASMHFGLIRNPASLGAHAWVDAAGIEVTGYPVPPDAVEVMHFR